MEELLDKQDQEKYSDNRESLRLLTIMLLIGYGLAVFGSAEKFFTINYSGPVVSVIGLMTLLFGLVLREKLVFIMGVVASISMVSVFTLSYFQEIKPHDVQYLMFIIGGICLLILIGLATWFFTSSKVL